MCAINCGCALPSHLSESMDVSWRDEAAALRDSNEVKEEQISVLRASLVQLNMELQRKDQRIAELEACLISLTNQIAVSMAPRNADGCTCLHCPCGAGSNGGQRSPVGSESTLTAECVAGEGLVRTLSPIEENYSERTKEEEEEAKEKEEGGRQWREGGRDTHSKSAGDRGHDVSGEGRRGGGCGRSRGSVGESRRDRSVGHHGKQAAPPRGMERMELEQQKLQQAISELDSAIAELELQPTSEHRLRALREERAWLMTELNLKVQQRLRKIRRNSAEVMNCLSTQLQNCSKEQMCEAVRVLDLAQSKFKTYIDHLLAVVLERGPALLEGMPRLQQSSGLHMELLRMASKGQLLEELQERERNTESLQNYASLLVQRVMEQAPDLIPSVVQLQETVGMEPDSVWEE